MENKIYARNREAEYNYFIEDKYEAGMVLAGIEAKSIVMGKANLRGSYVTIRNGECFLRQSHISLLDTINGFDKVEEGRDIKLLLNKREIRKIKAAIETEGYSCIPLDIHSSNFGKLKLQIAIVKGKKNYDKRESIKEKDIQRETQRALKIK